MSSIPRLIGVPVTVLLLCGAGLHSAEPLSPADAWRIGWPNLRGPAHSWAAAPAGIKLVDDVDKVRHMWRSEERIPSSKEQNAGWIGKVMRSKEHAPLAGGGGSPILVDGRVYLSYYEPAGEAMDETERYGGMRFSGGSAAWPYARRVHFEKTGAVKVALIEADDIVLCVDAMTGKTLWKRRFALKGNNYQTRKDPAVNQRTMCYARGRVYALGTSCRLYCLDAANGELLWETATADHQRLRQDKLACLARRRRGGYNGVLNPGHGFGYESLMAIDGQIVVKIAGGGLQAFSADTGQLVWTQPRAGVHQTNPLPAVWAHQGRRYLIGAYLGRVTCTDARTGEIVWSRGGFSLTCKTVAVHDDILVGGVKADPKNEKSELAVYAGFTITPNGLEPRWRIDPAKAGYWYHGNYPSIGHDGLLYIGRHPREAQRPDQVEDDLSEWLAVDPSTGEIKASFLTDKPYRCHHVALATLDDGWIWSKFGYRNFLYLRADGARRSATSLPFIADEGDMFGSAYSCPVASPYAAGIMIVRGQRHLHGLDFRAEPPTGRNREVRPTTTHADRPGRESPPSATAEQLAEQLTTDDEVQLRAALDELVRIDKEGRTSQRIASLLRHKNVTFRLLAADALAEMGEIAAPAALPVVEELLRPVAIKFAETGSFGKPPRGLTEQEHMLAGRLVYLCGRLGKGAAPLLIRMAQEATKKKPVREEILGSLAHLGPHAVQAARELWDAEDRPLALELAEMLVRHKTPLSALKPFLNELTDGPDSALKIRAAEWRLRLDANDAEGWNILLGLCGRKDMPREVRQAAADAIARRVILPHNGMCDDVRRRGVKAAVAAIRRGDASPASIMQLAGMGSFLGEADRRAIETARRSRPGT